MKNKIKSFLIVALSVGLFSSCVKEEYATPVIVDKCYTLTTNKEVADIYPVAINPTGTISNAPTYTDDDTIEGYVISSDEGGNFYQSMYFQPIDGSKGFNLSAEVRNIYNKYEPGRKMYLKLKGLAFANPTSFGIGLIFGAPPTDKYAVDRLGALNVKDHLFPSCEVKNEDEIVHQVTINQAKSDTYLNTLVEIDNVQFESDCGTYDTDRTDTFDSSINITDGTNTLVIRTSRYANFAGFNIPSGRGKIRGVLTKYGTGSNPYQIILRTERDVKFNNPRVDTTLPKVGNDIQYTGTITENFESYATTSSGALFPKYINDASVGGRYWDVKSFSNNKYIQMTSFGAGCSSTFLAIPVDLSAASNFSFKSKDGYYKGDVLKVYYSTNYIPGEDFGQATLIDITSNFAIAQGSTTGYATNFTNSGIFSIPTSLTGNGFFIFEYNGTATNTTTIQLDDVTIN